MSKRHNRKRTRSRPRHRDTTKSHPTHHQPLSTDPTFSYPSIPPSYFLPPLKITSTESWNQQDTWNNHNTLHHQRQLDRAQRDRDQMLELRANSSLFFGPHLNDDEVSLIEPMLKVVKDLFDGDIDYEDP